MIRNGRGVSRFRRKDADISGMRRKSGGNDRNAETGARSVQLRYTGLQRRASGMAYKGRRHKVYKRVLPAPQPTKVYVRKSGNKKGGRYEAYYHDHAVGKNKTETAKLRSKTFPGIARAMAEQWAGKITK